MMTPNAVRYAVDDDSFEVQEYLDAQARKFVDGKSSYDPNCYLVLSKVHPLQSLAYTTEVTTFNVVLSTSLTVVNY